MHLLYDSRAASQRSLNLPVVLSGKIQLWLVFLRGLLLPVAIAAIALSIAMETFGIGTPGFGTFQWLLLGACVVLSLTAFLPKIWFARVLLVFCSLTLTALFAEVVLRVTYSARLSSIYQVDEHYLYRLNPGSRKIFEREPINGGDSILVTVNSSGFLGEELRTKGNAKRIVVYGDSFIAGEFSRVENRFASKLEESLTRQLGTPTEVINAGVPGYGPDQAYLRMEQEIDSLKPDAVIFALFANNDFGDLLRNKLFSLDADGRLRRSSPFLNEQLRWDFIYATRAPFLLRLASKNLPVLFGYLNPQIPTTKTPPSQQIDEWLKLCKSEFDSYVTDRNLDLVNLVNDHYDADISVEPDGESSRFKILLMEQVIALTSELLRSKGIPLVLLIIPSELDAVEEYSLARVDVSRFPLYERRRLTRILDGQAQKLGIPHLNLFESFSSHGAKQLYFLGNDVHWNDLGQAHAAKLTADFLLKLRILDSDFYGKKLK